MTLHVHFHDSAESILSQLPREARNEIQIKIDPRSMKPMWRAHFTPRGGGHGMKAKSPRRSPLFATAEEAAQYAVEKVQSGEW